MSSRVVSAAPSTRRVVVTGIGLMTPLGNDVASTWSGLFDPTRSAVVTAEEALAHQGLSADELAAERAALVRSRARTFAAPVRGLGPADPRAPRFARLAACAGAEAVAASGLAEWWENDHDHRLRERVGVSLGVGLSSVRTVASADVGRLSPRFVPSVLPSAAASELSIGLGLRGPARTAASACAAGAHAVLDGHRCVARGEADVVLVGGAEACVDPTSLAGFARLRALSRAGVSRPFDAARDGFVMAEGAAVLVLEAEDLAVARGAPILAESLGGGSSSDAHHVAAPDPTGDGARRAAEAALRDARLDPADVDHVNAHATSTPAGDEAETRAIHATFFSSRAKTRATDLLVSSTKGATGHLLGAAGAVEAAFTVLALQRGEIPPTLHLDLNPERNKGNPCVEGVDFTHVVCDTDQPDRLRVPIRTALCNSFGFGGTNCALLFGKYEP